MPLVQTVAPTVEPLTIADAKLHCRVDYDDDNAIFTRLILAARRRAEHVTGRQLINATYQLKLPGFWRASDPLRSYMRNQFSRGAILLPRPPLSSLTSIIYLDTSNVSQTLATDQYTYDQYSEPAIVQPAYGVTWPDTYCVWNAVTITYVAGYGTAATSIPEGILAAMLQQIASWYVHRESTAIEAGIDMLKVPNEGDDLLAEYRIEDERLMNFV